MKKWVHLLGILSIPLQGLIYLWISGSAGTKVIYNYYWIDTKIPFLTWFAFPYVVWMPVLYLGFLYFGLTNRTLYWRTLITYNAAVTLSNVIFILFPTYVPRPELTGSGLATYLIQFVYQNDEPLNCLPSIHCLTSYLLFITINRHAQFNKLVRMLCSILLWLIIASTVFIKQHSIVDVIAGIVVAEGFYQLVHYYMSKYKRKSNKQQASLIA